jgi:hypothetical protein
MGLQQATLATTSFTLAWTHTVEKTLWEEDYLVAGAWLYLVAARIRGSGAGMEPPAGAVCIDDAWHYRPEHRWHARLLLARSEFGSDYQLCLGKRCRPLGHYLPGPPAPTEILACAEGTQPATRDDSVERLR